MAFLSGLVLSDCFDIHGGFVLFSLFSLGSLL